MSKVKSLQGFLANDTTGNSKDVNPFIGRHFAKEDYASLCALVNLPASAKRVDVATRFYAIAFTALVEQEKLTEDEAIGYITRLQEQE